MTTSLQPASPARYGATAASPRKRNAKVYDLVAARLGKRITGKAVEHKIANAVLLLELLADEAYHADQTDQCDAVFTGLNAHRHALMAVQPNALRRLAIATSTELVERSAYQESRDTPSRRREIEALAEEISTATCLMVQLEGQQ